MISLEYCNHGVRYLILHRAVINDRVAYSRLGIFATIFRIQIQNNRRNHCSFVE